MDDALLKERTKTVITLLNEKDPKYPKRNFWLQLMSITKQCFQRRGDLPADDVEAMDKILYIITTEIEAMVTSLEADKRWPEIMGGWHSCDIYEVLCWRVVGRLLPRRII